jgi:alanine dehydrogenase
MKFAIIKERKNPPDKRVVFSPEALSTLAKQYKDVAIKVESSDIRIYNDAAYQALNIDVVNDVADCDVFFGVKEVPIVNLIPNKSYFFFSHTIKKQPYNKKLLQAILEKNIILYDHETIVNETNNRLIGFGRYAGIVGTYNTIRAFGLKFELFKLPKAVTLSGKDALIQNLKRITLPPIKIVVTGKGKVGNGIKEVLQAMKMKEVSVADFLNKNYTQAIYTQIDVLDYNKRIDGKVLDNSDFYNNPTAYIQDFEKFTKCADMLITGHFYANDAPKILTREMLLAADTSIKVVGDISCDINGPIACTLRASTIDEPFYGYLPSEDKEVDFFHPAAIVVMAVDNLPCEIPKDASDGFGEMFLEHVIPAFFNGDKDGVLSRSKMTFEGSLTPRFAFLEDYVV